MDARERTFAAVMFGVHGMDHLLKQVFPPLLPIWAVAFDFQLWQLGFLMGARTFGSALGQAPLGVLADRYDRRLILTLGLSLMGVGLVTVAGVPFVGRGVLELRVAGVPVDAQFLALLAALLAIGIGSSTVHPTGYPLISANVAERHKGRVLGLWGSASKFGDGLGPAIIGAGLLAFAWNEIVGGLGLTALGFAALLFVLLGGFNTRPGVGAQEDASVDRPEDGAPDHRAFVYPLVAVAAYFVVLITAAGVLLVFLPEFITSTYGYELDLFDLELTAASTASFYFAALLFIAAFAQLATGALVDRFDERRLIVSYVGGAALVLVVLALADLSPVGLFVVLALLGMTLWGMNPARDALVSRITPPEREGRTFGYVWTVALLFTSVAPPVFGYVGDVAGLRATFLLLAGVVLASAVPILLLESERVYLPAGGGGEETHAD